MNVFEEQLNAGLEAMKAGRYQDAIKSFRSAQNTAQDNVYVRRMLGNCLRIVGNIDDAIDAYKEALAIRYHSGTHVRLLNTLNYTTQPQQTIAAEHFAWANQNCTTPPGAPGCQPERRRGKMRVGYVSPDFRSHPVAHFLLPIYRNHNRDRIEIFSFYNGDKSDRVTEEFERLSEHWCSVKRLNTQELYEAIVEQQIDILIDLAGHTSGNRLDVFALKPAPIQVTYLGYPNTTGLKSIDYRIVDALTDPIDVPESWNSEALFRIPGCFLCFAPPPESLEVTESPITANGFVTFGTFNKIPKINDELLQVWAEILRRVPTAKMILKSKGFEEEASKSQFRTRLLKAGLTDPDRIVLYPLLPTRSEHLLMYNQMDISLDTFPYNGTTTTMQALYMSVPVISLQGQSHMSRVSSSILSNLSLEELIAHDKEEYIEKAVALGNDAGRIRAYNHTLRDRMLASVLVDAEEFVKKLEAFFLSVSR